MTRKNSDLYLRKIQFSFVFEKFKSVSKQNIDQFLFEKKFKSISKENRDQFCV